MKSIIDLIKKTYNWWKNSNWIPFLSTLFICPIFTCTHYLTLLINNYDFTRFLQEYVVGCIFILVLIICFLYLTHIVISFINKRFKRGFLEILGIIFILPVIYISLLFILFSGFLGPSEDNFANDLKIPENVPYQTPLEYIINEDFSVAEKNSFQNKLMSAFKDKSLNTKDYKKQIPSLENLSIKNLNLLKRYLASSSEWNLTISNKVLQARHRWQINKYPHPILHENLVVWRSSFKEDNFQYRCYLNLGNFSSYNSQKANKPRIENDFFNLYTLIPTKNYTIEIFEQNKVNQPRLTAKTFQLLEEEFKKILSFNNFDEVKKLLPPYSVKIGKPDILLRKSVQGGIYNAEIWVNPKRSGYIYLKAFEITKNTQLSKNRLKMATTEYIGWSENSNEVYSSFSHFIIYEGDWNKHYLARFEVWFVPDDGSPEEKLLEKNFKIEGWMR